MEKLMNANNIKKFIFYIAIIGFNIPLLSAESIDQEIQISKTTLMPGTGRDIIIYETELPNNINITCERRLPNKPSCILRAPRSKKMNWQNWYILQELFELQEKKAKEDIEKFEQEFEEMKRAANSESDFVENLRNLLTANL